MMPFPKIPVHELKFSELSKITMPFPRRGDVQKLHWQLHVLVSLKPAFNCLGFVKDLVTKPHCAINLSQPAKRKLKLR